MKKAFSKYVWLWEFIGAALLASLGIIVGFLHNVLLVIVGLIFIFLGTFRFVPLLKTTDDKVLKWVFASELIIDVIIGIVLLIIGMKNEDANALKSIFGYLICGVIYLRGFVYLFSSAIRKEETKFTLFLFHLALITLASVLIGRGGFELKQLSWVILALCVFCSITIAFDGFNKYRKYRNEEYSTKISKKIKNEDTNDLNAPSADEIIEQGNIIEGENPENGLNA